MGTRTIGKHTEETLRSRNKKLAMKVCYYKKQVHSLQERLNTTPKGLSHFEVFALKGWDLVLAFVVGMVVMRLLLMGKVL